MGDRLVEVSWEEAFELAASRLAEIRETHGANAIATYKGNPTAHHFTGEMSYVQTLVGALGTKWSSTLESVDDLSKSFSNALLFGWLGTYPIPDIDRTDFILNLGANPLASNCSLIAGASIRQRLRRLQECGG